jgi:acyl-CoA synthetase (AMP-forming)/AMP-acid ligase II
VVATPKYVDRVVGLAPTCVLDRGRLILSKSAAAPPDGPADEGIIIGTGGTTGIPKGAVYSRAALWYWTICTAFAQQLHADDVELFGSPFFHSTLLTGMLTPLVAGATVCIPERFDAEHVEHAVSEYGVTRIGGAPTMLSRILTVARAHPDDWLGIRTIQFGSTKCPPGFVPAVRAAFPRAALITGYGSTEFGPVTRCYTKDLEGEQDAGVGRPVPAASVAIIDPETGAQTRQPGVQGEIAVAAPWQMSYYTGPIDATSDVLLPSGAIRSGDIGHFDGNGYLHLDGRSKDIIITGGENVFPAEVEVVLAEFPNVTELAVYGVADRVWGERVELAISVADGAAIPKLADIREYGRARLAPYKLPRSLAVLAELPLTSNMKLDKRRLATATDLPREIWPEAGSHCG